MIQKLVIVFLIFSCSNPKQEGLVVKVIDGDTIDILHNKKKTRIRLFGIDSPERGQAYSVKAREFTASLVSGKNVLVREQSRDQYGRVVGDVYLEDGTHVNAEIVKSGFAWHYKHYSNNPLLAQQETQARKQRRGLWQDAHPEPPWEFRKHKREKK